MTARRAPTDPPAQAIPPAASAVMSVSRARAEDQARRAFLRAVSHEMRTPLNAIIGFSEIIASELHGPIGEPRYREHAEQVRDSGLRLLKLVNQTLEIARLEVGVADLEPRSESVELAFAAAARTVQADFARRGLRLETAVGPGAGRVFADNRGLDTVLVNLLENAGAFSPFGGVVRMRASLSAGCVCIEVEDQGPGVSPRDLARLLRPFQHGEETPQRGGEGRGLSLAVVDLTCKAMGGRVRLQSAPEGGLVASVRLPRDQPAAA